MKIKLTAAQVERIIHAHVQANLPGVQVHIGFAEIEPGHQEWDSPYFAGFSFSFEPKKNKYEEMKEKIAGMDQSNLVLAVKQIRDLSRNFSPEEKIAFPTFKSESGYPYSPTDDREVFGLAYTKHLVQSVWKDVVPF